MKSCSEMQSKRSQTLSITDTLSLSLTCLFSVISELSFFILFVSPWLMPEGEMLIKSH